jgi:hypothetical protein
MSFITSDSAQLTTAAAALKFTASFSPSKWNNCLQQRGSPRFAIASMTAADDPLRSLVDFASASGSWDPISATLSQLPRGWG